MRVLLVALAFSSGLHGVVTRGPITPVCRAGVRCSAPAVGVVLLFSRAGHSKVRARTGAGGRYSVSLGPGYYTVAVSPLSRIGFGIRPARVHVASGIDARLDFLIDTGIR